MNFFFGKPITTPQELWGSSYITDCVGDKRVAIDLVIVKESLTRLWGSIRWVATWLQLADALTKENRNAMDILRGAMKSTVYHLNNESVMLQSAAEQRALRVKGKAKPPEGVGSEVLLVQDREPDRRMVKVSTKGCEEVEIRALFETMVERSTKSDEDYQAKICREDSSTY